MIGSSYFTRHITFSRNSKSGFKSRELKLIDFQMKAKVIKLIIQDCRKNPFNFHNQVSLVDIVVMGDRPVVVPNLLDGRQAGGQEIVFNNGVEMSEVD